MKPCFKIKEKLGFQVNKTKCTTNRPSVKDLLMKQASQTLDRHNLPKSHKKK